MEDWKERLGSYDSWAMNESMFITIDGETIYTLDELKDFISQELDKAREEGYKKAIRDVRGAIKNSKFDKNGKRIVSTVEVLVAPILDKLKE